MGVALEPPHVLGADAPMPRRRWVGCIGVACLLAALALVAPVESVDADGRKYRPDRKDHRR